MTIDFSKATAMEIENWNRCALTMVKKENIFTFPEGLFGFKNIKEYIFILNNKVRPFMFMHAMDGSDTCFICIEVFQICPDYNIVLSNSCINLLELKKPTDALMLSLVTVANKMENTTANLMSPLVINMANKTGYQVIADQETFPVRYKIWDALEKMGAPAIKAM